MVIDSDAFLSDKRLSIVMDTSLVSLSSNRSKVTESINQDIEI